MKTAALTAARLAAMYRRREVTVSEIVRAHFTAIARRDPQVHAYLVLDRDRALARADALDRRFARGDDLPALAGIPLAIKDNLCLSGLPLTCGSRMLENFRVPYDATVVEKLQGEEAIILGKTNMDEFAFGSSTETSFFGPTRNPHDAERVPGGSSGGSAAAVAAGLAVAALGSDTGGSIRQPAAFCGVVGLKPTYGRVSRYGLVAFASSLDQVGPFSRDVTDSALLLEALAGFDPRDATSLEVPVPDYRAAVEKPPAKLRLGLPREYFSDGLDPAVAAAVDGAVSRLRARDGVTVHEVSLPHTGYAIATYYVIASAEASANLARFDGVRYGYRDPRAGDMRRMYERSRADAFGAEVKRRIIMGNFVLSSGYYDAYYLKAQKVRTLIRRDFEKAFAEVDLLLTPTAPAPAFRLGEKISDPLTMYLSDVFTAPVNLAGLPALSVPAAGGRRPPVGLQLIAPPLGEERLLAVGRWLEDAS